ncbi:hypothetical protein KL937_004565 [Ogataea polymorpha]|nr:hypothetical protein KL937_004565 [Ogataea polymorpha]KAG7887134.1 hypothetical protein KL936_004655 [Ogataea polymorpha]KAG7932165.1 hypothetical protein KL904_004590 [Ogataea polymorpha]
MVLINGVKYACERCIRGHRVTTCTHVDQPMMMIKPKGRPSTQCAHCRQQRKLKNAHITCTCNSKTKEHDVSCACHVDGECTCSKQKKSSSKKKDEDAKDQKSKIMPPESQSLNVDKDNVNSIIRSWDMASPPLGSELLQNDSLLSLNSASSDKPSQGFHYQDFTKRQVGMDPLQNFRSSTPQSQQKKAGEIHVPVDEYVAPLNTMNNNFSTLMSSISTSEPVVPPATANGRSKSNSMTSEPFQGINTPGSGLLDSFDDNNSSKMYHNRNRNVSSGSVISSPRESINPDSLFPLFPLIGPSHSHSSHSSLPSTPSHQSLSDLILTQPGGHKLSHTNLNSHNSKTHHNYPQMLKKNLTGSSTHSSGSLSHSHHHGVHGHSHQSHYSPYPQNMMGQQPRRSNSFLSVSSSNTVNSSLGSPGSILTNERPPLVSANSTDSLNGFQLTNAKTNTTLMDDLYQTRTYTESGMKPFSMVPEEEDSGSTPASDVSQLRTVQHKVNPVFDPSAIGTIPLTTSSALPNATDQRTETTDAQTDYSSYLGNIDYLDSLLDQSADQADLSSFIDLQGTQTQEQA